MSVVIERRLLALGGWSPWVGAIQPSRSKLSRYMKMLLAPCAIVSLSLCLLTGCGQKTAHANTEMDKLKTSFATADPEIKDVVDKSLTDAKSTNYHGAFDDLMPLLKNPKVSADQMDSLRSAMHELSLLFPPPNPSMGMPKP
jgi:hypothetical protein